MPRAPIQVAIVEDHPLMREAIRDIVLRSAELCVCAVVSSAEDALALAAVAAADLVVSDLSLPGQSGLELIRALRAARPDRLCLVFSSHVDLSYVEAALNAGARGYVAKRDASELPEAFRRVLAGETYLSRSLLRK